MPGARDQPTAPGNPRQNLIKGLSLYQIFRLRGFDFWRFSGSFGGDLVMMKAGFCDPFGVHIAVPEGADEVGSVVRGSGQPDSPSQIVRLRSQGAAAVVGDGAWSNEAGMLPPPRRPLLSLFTETHPASWPSRGGFPPAHTALGCCQQKPLVASRGTPSETNDALDHATDELKCRRAEKDAATTNSASGQRCGWMRVIFDPCRLSPPISPRWLKKNA
jgi:hypothetical protein